jgi:hypothetical protein
MTGLTHRKFVLAAAIVGVLFATVLAGTAAAKPGPAWQLVDYHQRQCYDGNPTHVLYTIEIDGHWRHAIDVGIDLPSGGSYTTSYAPIPPGSSQGRYALANVTVFPSGIATGSYTLSLWATDGTIRDAVPVTLAVQDSCVGY